MKQKKLLESIIKNYGVCHTIDSCHICSINIECNNLLDKYTNKQGNLLIPMDKYIIMKKEIAINKYINFYNKEDLMEVLL